MDTFIFMIIQRYFPEYFLRADFFGMQNSQKFSMAIMKNYRDDRFDIGDGLG